MSAGSVMTAAAALAAITAGQYGQVVLTFGSDQQPVTNTGAVTAAKAADGPVCPSDNGHGSQLWNKTVFVNGTKVPAMRVKDTSQPSGWDYYVHQGDTVTVQFYVPAPCTGIETGLAVYTASQSTYSTSSVSNQRLYDLADGFFGPNTHTLTVKIPNCYFQIDWYTGAPLQTLSTSSDYATPDGTIIREADAANGGTQSCSSVTPITIPGDWESTARTSTTTSTSLAPGQPSSVNPT